MQTRLGNPHPSTHSSYPHGSPCYGPQHGVVVWRKEQQFFSVLAFEGQVPEALGTSGVFYGIPYQETRTGLGRLVPVTCPNFALFGKFVENLSARKENCAGHRVWLLFYNSQRDESCCIHDETRMYGVLQSPLSLPSLL